MEFNVAQLLKESVGAVRSYRLEEEQASYLKGVQRVKGVVQLLRVSSGILVTGRVETLVEMTCSRCLETFRQEVSFQLEEQYYPTVDVDSGLPLPASEDPTAFTIGHDHILDLREALRQYTILATPMKPICRTDCRGLCPQCGSSLNAGPCRCSPSQVDPRMEALRDLWKPS